MSTTIISIGLLLDIAGAAGIFRYGLPEALSRDGHVYLVAEQVDDLEAAKAKRYDKLAKAAMTLLIAGFILQLVGNLV